MECRRILILAAGSSAANGKPEWILMLFFQLMVRGTHQSVKTI